MTAMTWAAAGVEIPAWAAALMLERDWELGAMRIAGVLLARARWAIAAPPPRACVQVPSPKTNQQRPVEATASSDHP